jgi:hypothetical protein
MKLEAQWAEPLSLTFHSALRKLNTEPSIGASYQVSVHLVEGFQRRRLKCEKLTDDGRQVMAKAHIAFGKKKLFFCGKGDNSNLNIDISKIQLAMN